MNAPLPTLYASERAGRAHAQVRAELMKLAKDMVQLWAFFPPEAVDEGQNWDKCQQAVLDTYDKLLEKIEQK